MHEVDLLLLARSGHQDQLGSVVDDVGNLRAGQIGCSGVNNHSGVIDDVQVDGDLIQIPFHGQHFAVDGQQSFLANNGEVIAASGIVGAVMQVSDEVIQFIGHGALLVG